MNYTKFLMILVVIVIIIHLPRIIIELRSRSSHCEDTYQASKSDGDQRIMSWAKFMLDPAAWQAYVAGLKKRLITFYRENLGALIEEMTDVQLVKEINDTDIDPFTTEVKGDVLHTEIFHECRVVKTSFNHRWCSGGFFLGYATVLTYGDEPVLPEFPMTPFLPEYSLLKTYVKGEYIPASPCFSTRDSKPEDIMRLTYQIRDVSNMKGRASTRSYILWHIMSLLGSVHPKIYNIMIPLPFKAVAGIANNIGVIFIKWPEKGMSAEELDKLIHRKSITAVGTNLYLRGLNTSGELGKKTRNNVDIVFTSGYVRSPEVSPVASHVTFNGVADYGIYVFSITVKNQTDISMTFSTKDFPLRKLEEALEQKDLVPKCNVQAKSNSQVVIAEA